MKIRLLVLVQLIAAATAFADGPYIFNAIPPCRILDTRDAGRPTGGAPMANTTSYFFRAQGVCGIPVGAKAVSANFTITQPTRFGHLRLFPSSISSPWDVSTLNFDPSQTIANGAIVPLGPYSTLKGDLGAWIYVDGGTPPTAHLIIDVNGYFTSPTP